MNTLILTEKPSVAKDFARALGINQREEGFLEGGNYVVTWAVGHLLELAEPEDYDSRWKRWTLSSLPILPQPLKYKPIQNVQKQLTTIQRQLKRGDITSIIIATDAGREGEVIARSILDTVGSQGRAVYRFWTSQALTPQVIRDTLASLKPAAEYDRLWHAGRARQAADWLVGMNLSRAATLRLGASREVFSVGRVQTAVLALLVDRRRERENFKPQPYWIIRVHFSNEKGLWWGTWFKKDVNRFHDKDEAEQICRLVSGKLGTVKSVKREKKKQAPPTLYSLTDLQRDANMKYGLSAKQTLDLAQHLYEARKCLSYPRTDSKVLGSKNVELAKKIITKLSESYHDLFSGISADLVSSSNKRVFNDAKLTDHHALIPLAPLPANVDRDAKQIYDLVLRRFAAAFHPDYQYEATEIVTEAEGETFRTKGDRPLVPGWKAVYGLKDLPPAGEHNDEPQQENLPRLEKGDPAKVENIELDDKLTQPLPEYTEALLLKDMTNPSRYVSESELQKIFRGDVGLGTQATRAQIIETLLSRRYAVREKKKLMATDKGCFLIDNIRQLQKARAIATPEETARWEMELERIAQGAGDPDAFIESIRSFVVDGVEEFRGGGASSAGCEELGKCPVCGGRVIEGKKGFGCANWRAEHGGCRFVIWKQIAGKEISREIVQELLEKGQTSSVVDGFIARSGKNFSARLKIEEGSFKTVFVF